ncbi:hypothetical protein SCOR_30945 [Sulfidibacter corallicola]
MFGWRLLERPAGGGLALGRLGERLLEIVVLVVGGDQVTNPSPRNVGWSQRRDRADQV